MTSCPICATPDATPVHGRYFACRECDVWFQSPLPPKVLQHGNEPAGDTMSDAEKGINEQLAQYLLNDVMHGRKGVAVDVGAKFPWLSKCLKDRGYDAWAIEAHPDGAAYADSLGVNSCCGDFESMDGSILSPARLITLIHCFEHFYDPLKAIRTLSDMVRRDGRVFIRMPDHAVSGREQHLTADSFRIHPFMHTTRSLLHLLYLAGDAFALESATPMEGAGQTDFVLVPIAKAPQVYLGAIVKNEEKDLPRMLASAVSAVDFAHICDTGSTDGTFGLQNGELPIAWDVFTDASTRDEFGDWKLNDFSKARNSYLDAIAMEADWVLNLDADDELMTPLAIRRATYNASVDAYAVWIQDGQTKWLTHRLWRANKGIRYAGRCHEYPEHQHARDGVLDDVLIIHRGEPQANQENSNARNLRIMLAEWDDAPSSRLAFYIANTYRDAGKFAEAAGWYSQRIALGDEFRDEYLFAQLYLARCLNASGNYLAAQLALLKSIKAAPSWAEFPMALARISYDLKRYADCIELAQKCCDMPIPPTVLWREPGDYTDGPPRLISWCHELLGNVGQALAWAEIAKRRIGKPDVEWDARIERLANVMVAPKVRIAVIRPGAIGDVLMSLNLIPALKEANAGAEIHYFCDKSIGDGLRDTMLAAGVDAVMDSANAPIGYARVINLVGYLQPGYPEKPLAKHIIAAFGEEMEFAA